MSVFRETVHYSARQYIARYSQDFAMCILMVTLPPLFPMTFFFSYGVNPYYARPVISPFAFSAIHSVRTSCLSFRRDVSQRTVDAAAVVTMLEVSPISRGVILFPDRLQRFHSSPDGENPSPICFKSVGSRL